MRLRARAVHGARPAGGTGFWRPEMAHHPARRCRATYVVMRAHGFGARAAGPPLRSVDAVRSASWSLATYEFARAVPRCSLTVPQPLPLSLTDQAGRSPAPSGGNQSTDNV